MYTLVIAALGGCEVGELMRVQGHPGLPGKKQGSQRYTARACLEKRRKKKRKKRRSEEMTRLAKNGRTATPCHPVSVSQCPVDNLSIVVKPGPDGFLKPVLEASCIAKARVSWRGRLCFTSSFTLPARAAVDQKYQLGCMAVSL